MKKHIGHPVSRALRALCAAVAAACLAVSLSSAVPAQAATQAELQQQLQAYEQKLQQDKKTLAEMKDNAEEAADKKANLESQISTVKSQIAVLAESISQVQNSIGEKEQEIAAKEADIEQKQAELDAQHTAFGQRLAAMQEMHDSGTMAMLSSVTNLYQLLTFADVLQDISNKDTEIMNTMRQQKADLEAAKADLETAKADLEDQQTQLENQKSTMQSKQNELTSDLVQAGQDLADAKAAAADAQALVDSDQMNYEAVQDAITELLKSAESAHADLKFNGVFACPLSSYSRISSTFGTRTLNGVTKLHPGVDFAAPAGTTIYAAADGYVTAAGWNSGGYGYYVLIYHGQMPDGNTYSTLYGHMLSAPSVSAGTYVTRGTAIGQVGSSGYSTGNHLHLELWQGSSASNSIANKATRINPLSAIPA